jgi:hypothetical protein
LREPEDGKVRFVNLTLEDVIEVIRLSDQAHAEALHHRYCDFWLVDGALELNAKRFGLPAKRPARKPAPAPEDAVNPVPAATPIKRSVSRGKAKMPAADFAPQQLRLRGPFRNFRNLIEHPAAPRAARRAHRSAETCP